MKTISLSSELVLEEIPVEGYEKVMKAVDPASNLTAIIAIHNTKLGPSLGGTRIYPYPTFEAALTDALRLAKGMTYKSALAGAGLGGAKSVILSRLEDKTPEKLIAFAQAVNLLKGEYTCAEDAGCNLEDITLISHHTPYVVGIEHAKSSGNPAPFTAWGTFRGIQAVLQKMDGSPSVEGKTVAIQGLGNVGSLLAEILFWHGARLICSDIDWDKTVRLSAKFGAKACPVEDIMGAECDVLAPCAMGAALNPTTIPLLRCRAVAGCANNQLLTEEDGESLRKRGILYAPDFVINAGGLINVSEEVVPEGYNPCKARNKVDALYTQLLEIFEIADQKGCSTNAAAIALGDTRLKEGLTKRTTPLCYHHAT